jgi:hypothetical protein
MQLKGKPCGALSRTCLLELEDTSILFMDLTVACVDDYSAVHEIRQIEHTEFESTQSFGAQALLPKSSLLQLLTSIGVCCPEVWV